MPVHDFGAIVTDEAIDAETLALQVRREQSSNRVGGLVAIAVAWVVVFPLASLPVLAGWTALRLAGMAFNGWVGTRVQALGELAALRAGWQRQMDFGLFWAGLSWGGIFWVMPPIPWSFTGFFIVVLVVLVQAVLAQTVALSRWGMLAFQLGSVLGGLPFLLMQTGPYKWPTVIGALGLNCGMLMYSRGLRQLLRASAREKLLNVELLRISGEARLKEQAQNEQLQQLNIQLAEALQTTRQLAHYDPLTGCANRQFFLEQARHEMAVARRTREPLALAMVDFDHFKRVNDVHGHLVGDAVLREGAVCMRGALREGDLLARYGGEEFVLLLARTNAEEAERVIDRVCASLALIDRQGLPQGLAPTVSIGWTVLQPSRPFDEALARADQVLYAAKAAGRNRVQRAEAPPSSHVGLL